MKEAPRVLLIDDNVADRQLAMLVLKKSCPQVRIRAILGEEDFGAALAQGGFQLVITDYHLGWSDGLSVLKKLRIVHPGMPILFFCRPVSKEKRTRIRRAAPGSYLPKSSASFLRLPRVVGHRLGIRTVEAPPAPMEGRLTRLMELSNTGVFRANIYGRLLAINAAFARLLGERSIRNALRVDLTCLHYRAANRAEILQRVERDGRTHRQEIQLKRPDGEKRWLALTETVVVDRSGKIVIDGLLENSFENRRAGTDLIRSNRDLKEFAYVASHQLQQPLRLVEQYTRLLVEDYPGALQGQAGEYLECANRAARRMRELIDNLLALSQIDAGRALQNCASDQSVAEAVENLLPAVEEKQALVRWDSLPRVVADPGQLVQLFQNLISNSLKFQKEATVPRVWVDAQLRNGCYRFSVRDNGIGMEPTQVESIFSPFKRLQPPYPGTGLGLTICRRIVERHGGRIWAESKPVQGTTVYFTLPVTRRQQPAVRSASGEMGEEVDG
ncbi:MAG: ATP-binding protein [Acidobacteriota bacterium]